MYDRGRKEFCVVIRPPAQFALACATRVGGPRRHRRCSTMRTRRRIAVEWDGAIKYRDPKNPDNTWTGRGWRGSLDPQLAAVKPRRRRSGSSTAFHRRRRY
jgi:hypothetical protein